MKSDGFIAISKNFNSKERTKKKARSLLLFSASCKMHHPSQRHINLPRTAQPAGKHLAASIADKGCAHLERWNNADT